MKKAILFLILVLPLFLNSQQWTIDFGNVHTIRDGIINTSNQAVCVGRGEAESGTYCPFVYRVYENGEYETYTFLEYENVQFRNIIQLPDGNYFVSGVEEIPGQEEVYIVEKIYYIIICILDENMNVIGFSRYSADNGFGFSSSHDVFYDEGSVLLSSSIKEEGAEYNRDKLALLRFTEEGELISSVYPSPGDVLYETPITIPESQIRKKPDGSGYVILAKGTNDGMQFLLYDNDLVFEEIVRIVHPDVDENYQAIFYAQEGVSSDLWLTDESMLLFGTTRNRGEDAGNHNFYGIALSSVNCYEGTVDKVEYIMSDSCYSAFRSNKSMCYFNDSTVYGGYWSYYDDMLSARHIYSQICLFTKDLEVLGTITVENDSEGHILLSFNNGDCLFVGNRCSLHNYNTTIRKFTRADFNPVYVSVKEVKEEEIVGYVYPNPAVSEINIDMRNIANDGKSRIRISDLSGRTLVCRIIEGRGNILNVDVSNLSSGTYLYEIINANTVVSKGKFIKK